MKPKDHSCIHSDKNVHKKRYYSMTQGDAKQVRCNRMCVPHLTSIPQEGLCRIRASSIKLKLLESNCESNLDIAPEMLGGCFERSVASIL